MAGFTGIDTAVNDLEKKAEGIVYKYGPTVAFVKGVLDGATSQFTYNQGSFSKNLERQIDDAFMEMTGYDLNLGGQGTGAQANKFILSNLIPGGSSPSTKGYGIAVGGWIYGQTDFPFSKFVEKIVVPYGIGRILGSPFDPAAEETPNLNGANTNEQQQRYSNIITTTPRCLT